MPIRSENRERYPKHWPEISRRIRNIRAQGRCECDGRCGVDHKGRCARLNGESGVVLTVAHLDHTPENCDDENLRAMCQGCHLRYDRWHHVETRTGQRGMKESAGELAFWAQLRSAKLRGWEREYLFAHPRRWRFDFACPSLRLAVEIEGASWAGGRHTRGSGFARDCEKYCEAVARGWRVLRGTTEQAESGWLLDYVRRCL